MRLGLVLLALILAACTSQPPRDDSLYRSLGEQAGITRIVEGMLLNSARNPRIAHYFREIDIERANRQFRQVEAQSRIGLEFEEYLKQR